MLATLPIAFWELSVGTWLLVKGFTPSPATANLTKVDLTDRSTGAWTSSAPRAQLRRTTATEDSRSRAAPGPPPSTVPGAHMITVEAVTKRNGPYIAVNDVERDLRRCDAPSWSH